MLLKHSPSTGGIGFQKETYTPASTILRLQETPLTYMPLHEHSSKGYLFKGGSKIS